MLYVCIPRTTGVGDWYCCVLIGRRVICPLAICRDSGPASWAAHGTLLKLHGEGCGLWCTVTHCTDIPYIAGNFRGQADLHENVGMVYRGNACRHCSAGNAVKQNVYSQKSPFLSLTNFLLHEITRYTVVALLFR